jgi:potassium-transporting ATPase KdpC subunit
MRRQLVPAVFSMIVFTVVLGLIYPLVITGVAQVLFNDKADGSIIERDGQAVGSELIGQQFTEPIYFWPRPSAVGENGYDASTSGGSNLGPTNPDLIAAVGERVVAYREANGLSDDALVPVDAVTASGSGLDPHISVANARIQAARVADARGATLDDVLALVDEHTEGQSFGFLGEKGVDVLQLNLDLDAMFPAG